MTNPFKNKRMIILPLALVLVISFALVAFAAEPGSSSDPLVTVSYLENKVSELKTSLQKELEEILTTSFTKKFDQLSSDTEKTLENLKKNGTATPSTFEVVNLLEGDSMICGGGTELIVRSGRSTAITTATGGLSDVTAGKDIGNGETILNNHHLIVPRDDGRGIKASISGAIMVKGSYEIKKAENAI